MDDKWRGRLVAIKHGHYLGKRFKEDMPMIADAFRSCLTVNDILYEFDIGVHYKGSDSSRIKGITNALGGYRGSIKGLEHYEGLMLSEEFDLLKKIHWGKSAKKLALEKGQVPWVPRLVLENETLPSELEMAHNLSFNHDFKKGSRVDNKKISDYLNSKFHGGKPVRDGSSVSSALARVRRKLEGGEGYEHVFGKYTIPYYQHNGNLWLVDD